MSLFGKKKKKDNKYLNAYNNKYTAPAPKDGDFTTKRHCDICGVTSDEKNMISLYDGQICRHCFDKIGVRENEFSVSLKTAIRRINLYNELEGDISKMPPFPYDSIEDYEISLRSQAYIFTPEYQKLENKYYATLPKIDTLWSILYNLKDYSGENATKYEAICLENIATYEKIYCNYCIPYNTRGFGRVPAYKRLAMLYEKQGRYEEAVFICVDAIQHGAPNESGDGGSKKMYARLARMAKKANLLDNDKVKPLLDTTN